jgi:uncharacterized protein YheU (UPF0270 family)
LSDPVQPQPVVIDWQDLSPEALRNVLEDLVSRGEPDEMAIDARCDQLLQAIKKGKTGLYFDPVDETIFIRNL